MRKQLTLAALAATAAMAFAGFSAATAAAEPIEVWDSNTYEPCPGVSYNGSQVSGGCEIDGADGGYQLEWFPGSWGSYDMSFDLRVDGVGSALAYDQSIGSGMPPFYAPCDKAGGSKIPWPIQFSYNGGQWEAVMTIKLRSAGGSPGTCGGERTIPFDMSLLGAGSASLTQNAPVSLIKNANWGFGPAEVEFVG